MQKSFCLFLPFYSRPAWLAPIGLEVDIFSGLAMGVLGNSLGSRKHASLSRHTLDPWSVGHCQGWWPWSASTPCAITMKEPKPTFILPGVVRYFTLIIIVLFGLSPLSHFSPCHSLVSRSLISIPALSRKLRTMTPSLLTAPTIPYIPHITPKLDLSSPNFCSTLLFGYPSTISVSHSIPFYTRMYVCFLLSKSQVLEQCCCTSITC
ncbi:hypothetical protein DFP72DRAFT_324975 [Ephemerocybe angulata]|uniref:Uncharacterized protein n=1 Tax=Ephemerocybe angulata TaxID=980116 RepID=A0A8H6MD42_9AGAR|nr:hypothetical protein DFP72DRAFT_324975 [Tulosesus angulatus]